jgi:hypothetical protein
MELMMIGTKFLSLVSRSREGVRLMAEEASKSSRFYLCPSSIRILIAPLQRCVTSGSVKWLVDRNQAKLLHKIVLQLWDILEARRTFLFYYLLTKFSGLAMADFSRNGN